MTDAEDVPVGQLKMMMYGGPILYGAVTAYIGVTLLTGITQTVALVMAVLGTAAGYFALKKIYESQYGVTL